MRILLVSGHKSGHNVCKKTGVNEGDLNIELVKALKSQLDPYAKIDVYPYDRDMYLDNRGGCLKVNFKDYNYIFEVHFNAATGSARGTSVQVHTNYKGGISVEQGIVDNLAAVGFKKRGTNGIVFRNDLLNMNTALNKSVDYALVEVCFYDNADDIGLYKRNRYVVTSAIANGIIKGFGLKKGTTETTSIKTAEVTGCKELNIRKTPNGLPVLTTVKVGAILEVLGSDKDSDGDNWTLVRTGNIVGYVWPKYIK